MHQLGKHWIELGVLALLGVLATPLACGGASEMGAAAGAGTAGFVRDGAGNTNPCVRCEDMGGTGCPHSCFGDGAALPNGGSHGGMIGVDDGSDLGIGGIVGYFDGAPDEAGAGGVAGSGAHSGHGGGSAVGGGPHFDGAPYFTDGH